jgi:hypothetical protein
VTATALDPEFTADFGCSDKESWDKLLSVFRDASLYQTWSYDRVRHGRPVVSMVLRRRGTLVAAAQAGIVRLPGAGAGIAYARWAPLWRRSGVPEDTEVFRQAVRALRHEFSQRRGLVLRLYPLAYQGPDDELATILREEGYRQHDERKGDRTLIIDLQPPLEELRAALDQKWRNRLNKAEKSGLDVRVARDESLFDALGQIHNEMLTRKGPVEVSDLVHLKAIQRSLSSGQKLSVILSSLKGEPCAGGVFTALGDTGIYLRGATSDAGLKTNGSYLVHWAFVRWLKENSFRYYDLNGINPEANPGTYHFKRGLAGKQGQDTAFLGRFQIADRPLSDWLVKEGERVLSGYNRFVRAARLLRARATRHL